MVIPGLPQVPIDRWRQPDASQVIRRCLSKELFPPEPDSLPQPKLPAVPASWTATSPKPKLKPAPTAAEKGSSLVEWDQKLQELKVSVCSINYHSFKYHLHMLFFNMSLCSMDSHLEVSDFLLHEVTFPEVRFPKMKYLLTIATTCFFYVVLEFVYK